MPATKQTEHRDYWSSWASFLRRYRLEGIATWALESLAPLTVLAAQLLYAGKPLLGSSPPGSGVLSLAHMLEDAQESRAFLDYLQQEREI